MSMVESFNLNALLTGADSGVIIAEGAQVDPTTLLPLAYHNLLVSIVQLYVYVSSILCAFQAISMFIAAFTSNTSLRSALVKLNLFLSLCLLVFNGWIIHSKQSIYTSDGLYMFWASFIFYVIDFFILSFLSEVLPFITGRATTNEKTSSTGSNKKKNK
ncbi:hypothetical protein SAMD00019534_042080 [Acytostelium subglobosum LB1]|uniref:hypothetical protein n=1 Tax=Acytostelium subglobosum LB1 TaxID=1410327 RepID=UPI000644D97D|nr:hypothetical protein SAMD00019534_042080 [Acytostelium subglobosum LB1]GAM21033.1 hypothetical protein SAMD00019534_042080 [Acytostelium subglobosum LB1]|eukprot:XP_012756167.1 hypothetical protein SAMD00019534_042080 [Acytostelium subglobosum LB1]